VFKSPSAFSVSIKRLANPARKADDGWTSVKYAGSTLNLFRPHLEALLAHGQAEAPPVPPVPVLAAPAAGGGGGGPLGAPASAAAPARGAGKKRPSSKAARLSPYDDSEGAAGSEEHSAPAAPPSDEVSSDDEFVYSAPTTTTRAGRRTSGTRRLQATPPLAPAAPPPSAAQQAAAAARRAEASQAAAAAAAVAAAAAAAHEAPYSWLQCSNPACLEWRLVRPDALPHGGRGFVCAADPRLGGCEALPDGDRAEQDPEARAADEAASRYAAASRRPPLDACTAEHFEADLAHLLEARGERALATMVRERRITW